MASLSGYVTKPVKKGVKELQELIEDYLARGGDIKKIPTGKRVLTESQMKKKVKKEGKLIPSSPRLKGEKAAARPSYLQRPAGKRRTQTSSQQGLSGKQTRTRKAGGPVIKARGGKYLRPVAEEAWESIEELAAKIWKGDKSKPKEKIPPVDTRASQRKRQRKTVASEQGLVATRGGEAADQARVAAGKKAGDLGTPASAATPESPMPLRGGKDIREPGRGDAGIARGERILANKNMQKAWDNKKKSLKELEAKEQRLSKRAAKKPTDWRQGGKQQEAKTALKGIQEKIKYLKASMKDMEKRYNIKVSKRGGGQILKKRHGGMTHVGLSPAEEARAGTMSEAKRARYMQAGGPIHTTFSKRADPRKGRAPAVDLFPEVGRKKGKKVGKKKQGYKAREDESVAQRVKKKRTPKQLKASRHESYSKPGSGKGKGKINRISSKQTDGNKLVASLYD